MPRPTSTVCARACTRRRAGARSGPGATSLGELILAICTERAPDLASVAPWVPHEMAAAIQRGLSRGPRAQRWQDMQDFAEALSVHAPGDPVDTGPAAAPRSEPSAGAAAAERRAPVVRPTRLQSFETQGVRPAVAMAAVLPHPVARSAAGGPGFTPFALCRPAFVALLIAGDHRLQRYPRRTAAAPRFRRRLPDCGSRRPT